MEHSFALRGDDHAVWLSRADGGYVVHVGDASFPAGLVARGGAAFDLVLPGGTERVFVACRGDDVHIHLGGETFALRGADALTRFAGHAADDGAAVARAPMPGAAIAVAVQAGDPVRRGQALLVIESMKMETTVVAPCDGAVRIVHVTVGQTFDRDAILVSLERHERAP